MEIVTPILGGLGLFFVGIRGGGTSLQQLVGRRLRAALRRAMVSVWGSAMIGAALGALTQSSNAVAFIVTGMLGAGLVPLAGAVTVVIWSNIGTAGLVLLASVDLRIAALWLLGVVGTAIFFRLDAKGRLRPALEGLFALGLLFLGLVLVRTGAALLHELDTLRELMGGAGGGLLLPAVTGAVLTLLTQSSAAVSILALTLNNVGILSFEQTLMVAYGASLGAGLSVLTVTGNLSGTLKQPALHQALFKVCAAVLFILLFFVERDGGVPLVLALTRLLAKETPLRVAWAHFLLQLLPALAIIPFQSPLIALVRRFSPPTGAEALARPQFLYEQALEDPPGALELVAREQERLLSRLPGILDELREDAPAERVPRAALVSAGASLEGAIGTFLSDILARSCGREETERAVLLEGRNRLLRDLRESLDEFAATIAAARSLPGTAMRDLLDRLCEAAHHLLVQLGEAAGGTTEDIALLQALAADRGEMMRDLRRRAAQAEQGHTYAEQELLLRATTLFERIVWQVRRFGLLLSTESDAGMREMPAPEADAAHGGTPAASFGSVAGAG